MGPLYWSKATKPQSHRAMDSDLSIALSTVTPQCTRIVNLHIVFIKLAHKDHLTDLCHCPEGQLILNILWALFSFDKNHYFSLVIDNIARLICLGYDSLWVSPTSFFLQYSQQNTTFFVHLHITATIHITSEFWWIVYLKNNFKPHVLYIRLIKQCKYFCAVSGNTAVQLKYFARNFPMRFFFIPPAPFFTIYLLLFYYIEVVMVHKACLEVIWIVGISVWHLSVGRCLSFPF